jgi:hypothetical protein
MYIQDLRLLSVLLGARVGVINAGADWSPHSMGIIETLGVIREAAVEVEEDNL